MRIITKTGIFNTKTRLAEMIEERFTIFLYLKSRPPEIVSSESEKLYRSAQNLTKSTVQVTTATIQIAALIQKRRKKSDAAQIKTADAADA